jgi:sialate O-acetylesterase
MPPRQCVLALACALVVLLAAVLPAAADVRLPAVISDGMVLQRDMPLRLWGWAEPGEPVAVSVAGQQVGATAGADGRWDVRLAPLAAGGPHELTVTGRNTLTVRDVLVGEVWFASGQSNMELKVSEAAHAPEETATARFPDIRIFMVPPTPADAPAADVPGRWAPCTPTSVGDATAVGYYFARHVHVALGVPVGLMCSAVGATSGGAWVSREALAADPRLNCLFDVWSQFDAMYHTNKAAHETYLALWEQEAARARAEGRDPPPKDRPPVYPVGCRPAAFFNGMVAPLTPYAVRGVLWYQGEWEAGSGVPGHYRVLLPALIRDWRSRWGRDDLPFLIVQLPNYRPRNRVGPDTFWAEVREVQRETLAVPHTALVVTIDLGDAEKIHPPEKREVGRRLALAAEATVYGQALAWSGPLYQSMTVEGQTVRVRFTHADGGLKTTDGRPPQSFLIAGADGRFFPADAAIDRSTVVVRARPVRAPGFDLAGTVTAPANPVPHPAAVRYAWSDNPVATLCNRAGLPASPFRTDNWSLISEAEEHRRLYPPAPRPPAATPSTAPNAARN